MALLWMDGFDHYGGNISNMLNGVWAQTTGSLSTVNPRTGTHHFLRSGSSVLRRVLGGAKTTVGFGAAYYLTELPSENDEVGLLTMSDASNLQQISFGIQSTGTMTVVRGGTTGVNGTVIHTTATPVVVAEAYQHIEFRVGVHSTNGSVEVRVNGVTVINLVDVDTNPTGAGEVSQLSLAKYGPSSSNTTTHMDDVFAWDDTGTTNNDFLGDRRVRTIYPDSDTATAEWSIVGAVNGFDAINQTGPDGDTTYIEADTNVPVTSEFGLQDLPASTGAIAAVQTYIMQRKTEAGDGNTQTSLISGASVADGADRPITEVYTYGQDVFETDPDTGSAWTKAGVDAAKLRLRRTL